MFRFLCAADMHLGRKHLLPVEIDPVKKTWERLIAMATSPKWDIDALFIAGDLVVSNDLFFDLLPMMKESVAKLEKAGVPMIVIAGNHDYFVTEQLWKAIDSASFVLLGRGGMWERKELMIRGKRVAIDGWSFPTEHYEDNPFDSYRLERVDHVQIGLMHGDVFDRESRYAPFSVNDMRKLPHTAWVCGHIHNVEVFLEEPLGFYTGSLQGLDPSERGSHGAHILEVSVDGVVRREFHPLAVLEWREMEWGSSFEKSENVEAVGCRVHAKGNEAVEFEGEIVHEEEGCCFFVEKVIAHKRERNFAGEDLIALMEKEVDVDDARRYLVERLSDQEYVHEEKELSDEELRSLLNRVSDDLAEELVDEA